VERSPLPGRRRGERSFRTNVVAEQKFPKNKALQLGLEHKAKEFKESGAEVYANA
jgi:hypothetical protein